MGDQVRPRMRLLISLCALAVAAVPAPAVAAPPNDDFANAAVVTLPFTRTLDVRTATVEPDEPARPCGSGALSKTVWYRFTPASNMRLYVTSEYSSYEASIHVFRHNGVSLHPISCGGTSHLIDNIQGGVTYWFRIAASVSETDAGDLEFRAREVAAPTHDDFDAARTLSSFPFLDVVDPRTATQAPDDPVCGTGSSIWYRYTPPARTRFLIGFGDGGEDASIGIYTGSRGALNRVGCWTFGHADLIVTGGRTYHVMLKGLPNIGYGWPVWFATEKLKKSLTLRVDKSRVVFGGKVRLRARLGSIADLNDFQLKFYSTTNGVKRLVARGYVNPQGDLIRYVRPQRTTSYTVEWAGEERYYPATSDWRRVEVAAKVVTTLERFYARSGADRLYRRGIDPRVLVKVRPNHAGQRISLFLEAQVGSTWHDVGLSRFRLGSKSAVRIRIVRPAAGYRYRVRAWFHGDDDHLPNDARPVYFRVVG